MNWMVLIYALITVESSGINTAVGDYGKSIGCLQIQEGVIKDVNRIYTKEYTKMDRYGRHQSVEICKLYLTYWGSVYERNTGKEATYEVLARIWNGGPYGYKKEKTKVYWAKVKRYL